MRAAAIGRSLFRADGFEVHDKWTKLEGEPAAIRGFLERYVPRYVRLHPDDASKVGEFGLSLEAGRLVSSGKPTAPVPAPPPSAKAKEGATARK